MRMLLYRPESEPIEQDVDASVDSITPVIGTDQYEWMTVRMLMLCIIHDPNGKDKGMRLNRILGTTPIYGDFLVCGIDWDKDGNTFATPLDDQRIGLLKNVIFNKIPTEGDLTDHLPSYARKRS